MSSQGQMMFTSQVTRILKENNPQFQVIQHGEQQLLIPALLNEDIKIQFLQLALHLTTINQTSKSTITTFYEDIVTLL
jgi:hypothetical protein